MTSLDNSLAYVVSIAIFLIIVLIVAMFFASGNIPFKRNPSKKKSPKNPPDQPQDWTAIIARREKYIETLKDEIAKMVRVQKDQERELEVNKESIDQLKEKLKLERSWREKEVKAVDKNNRNFQQLKDDLMTLEQNFEKEHSANLRLERDLRELKQEFEITSKENKQKSLDIMKLNATVVQLKKELAEQKGLNTELSRKTNDADWVAKTDYEQLEKMLQEKEKELERVSRENADR